MPKISYKTLPCCFICFSHKTEYIKYQCLPAKIKGLLRFLPGFSLLQTVSFPSVCSPPLSPFCFSFYPQENCLSWPESERLHPRQVAIVLNAILYTMPLSQMAWNCWECIAEIEIVWNDKDWIGLKDVASSLKLNSTWDIDQYYLWARMLCHSPKKPCWK